MLPAQCLPDEHQIEMKDKILLTLVLLLAWVDCWSQEAGGDEWRQSEWQEQL